MFSIPTLVSLLLLAVPKATLASPCITFDASFNLLAFGFDGKDYNAGTQDTWASGTATDITATGRPPFDGTNTTCYLSQFFNAVYVIDGDKANPSNVHIYDAGSKSWTTQQTTAGTFDPTSYHAILDHDTNVFYAVSKSELFFLDMSSLTAANSTPLPWVDVGATPYDKSYSPVMALAQNHIHFLDVPGNSAGMADIFVIHFSFFQPEAQSYSPSFPASHGQTTSFFQTTGVQQEFAFIPDDFSNVWVINVETNSTSTLAAPTSKDTGASYAASITALVQLDSTGAVSFIPYKQGDATTNSAQTWTTVKGLAALSPASSSSSAPGTSGSSGTGKPTGSASHSASVSQQTTGSPSSAMSTTVSVGVVAGAVFAALAAL
ncbi:uncharacterized protein BXZ73DRAFT_42126 [Epithele typhae]|uniref:uncharacterized protein n=1 Tax=Epithele typhae TaxID=378194 RepID=UPI0020074281|nr:uncharacterized protein BXZ73DRAFT_42126 [Epithele typhae]KAH9941313.1 hypothetical protein BXZ73DRAFT_42126 [Epithele typhae]